MNRRTFIVGTAALVAGSVIFGCDAADQETKGAVMPIKVQKGKIAIVYFSRSGNTRYAAEKLAGYCGGAKLVEIKALKPYAEAYRACCDEAQPECRGKLDRAYAPVDLDLAQYDVVLFGTPNWWGTMAPPLRTYVKDNLAKLAGKTVGIFQTHGGGGLQEVGSDFAELIGDRATVLPPKAWYGATIKMGIGLEGYVSDRLLIQ